VSSCQENNHQNSNCTGDDGLDDFAAEFKENIRTKCRMGDGDSNTVISNDDERRQRRRKSSALSSYSEDGHHVIHPPCCIGAFNVKRFGVAKLKDKSILDILVRLVREFDILLVLEVVDVTGEAIKSLLVQVNKSVQFDGDKDVTGLYNVLVSPRVGRTTHKEQYAIFYRTSIVQIKESEVYSDPGDVFIREPFIVNIHVSTVVEEAARFCLICIHTQPKSANVEIDTLVDVHAYVHDKYNEDNIIILGDLNASGPYIRTRDWEKNRLRNTRFNWLIPDHMDTTATNTLAAYDRIIVSGHISSAVVPESAKVFRYDEAYEIQAEQLIKVSDHYPVCFSLTTEPHPAIKKNTSCKLLISVEDKRFIHTTPQLFLLQFKLKRFKVREFYEKNGDISWIQIMSHKISELSETLACLESLRNHNRDLVSYSSLASIKYQVAASEGGFLKKQIFQNGKGKYRVILNLDVARKKIISNIEMNL